MSLQRNCPRVTTFCQSKRDQARRWLGRWKFWIARNWSEWGGGNGGQVGEHMGHLACHQLAWDQSKPQQLLLDPLNFLSKLRMTRLVWGCVAWVEISCMEKPSRRWASTKRSFSINFLQSLWSLKLKLLPFLYSMLQNFTPQGRTPSEPAVSK